MLSRTLAVAASVSLFTGCVAAPSLGTPGEDGDDDGQLRALIGGEDAVGGQFPSTVTVDNCTATKVADNKILLAAHCVWNEERSTYGGTLVARALLLSSAVKPYNADGSLITAKDPRQGFAVVDVKGVYIDPGYRRMNGEGFHATSVDLAVVVVADEEVPVLAQIPAAKIDWAPVGLGVPVTIMGYGCDTAVGAPSATPYHLKFAHTRTIDGRAEWKSYFFSPTSNAKGCQGDSGGPVYGPSGLVGVTSAVHPDYNIHTRLGDTWLQKALADSVEQDIYFDMDGFGTTCRGGRGTVVGAIKDKYMALGGCNSVLSVPYGEEEKTPDGVGRYVQFKEGSIYWKPGTEAYEVHGAIRDAWAKSGWEKGPLGYPKSDERTVAEGSQNEFEHGTITWNGSTAVVRTSP